MSISSVRVKRHASSLTVGTSEYLDGSMFETHPIFLEMQGNSFRDVLYWHCPTTIELHPYGKNRAVMRFCEQQHLNMECSKWSLLSQLSEVVLSGCMNK